MAKRYPVSKSKSKKIFKKTASKVHKKNISPVVFRGGIRL